MASFGGGATPWPHSIKHRSGQSMLDSPIPFTILCELEGFFFPLIACHKHLIYLFAFLFMIYLHIV